MYILKEKSVTIDLKFFTFESAYETIKNLINVLMGKSHASEIFLILTVEGAI